MLSVLLVILYKFLFQFSQYVGSTHNYKNSRQARLAIYELGEDIKAGKLPAHFGPLSFVFTGSGNVSQVRITKFNFVK